MTRLRAIDACAAAVIAPGMAALVLLLQTGDPPLPSRDIAAFLLFAVAAAIGQLLPIRGREHGGELAISNTFVFAILLVHGPGPALTAQALSSVLADLYARKPLRRTLFNVGQYTLSWAAAAAVMRALGAEPGVHEHGVPVPSHLPAMTAGAVAFFVVNSLLARSAIALAEGLSLRAHVLADLGPRAATTAMLMGLAPAIAAVHESDLVLAVLIVLPMTAIHRAIREAAGNARLATHDALTGMPNRELFMRRVQAAVEAAAASGRPLAVATMDLNRFREINDTLGHRHGDALLVQVGARLQALLGHGGTAGRLGGDEFAVLLHPHAPTAESAVAGADQLLRALAGDFMICGVTVDLSASAGVAVHRLHGDDADTLLRRADIAMYRAKEAQSSVAAYDAQSDDNSVDRLAMVAELRHAIATDQLELHYQPKLHLEYGAVPQVEALVRWRHPVRGLMPPADFIPLAERTGLIRPMTMVVLDQALSQCAAWRSQGITVAVAVNLSAYSLIDEGLPKEVGRLLASHRLAGGDLVLEVTESVVMADPERATRTLCALAAIGVGVAIDDFGTGYSSLGYLKRLPVDELKIDRAFVSNLARDPDDALIVRSTIEMARGLRLRVVAEGVEDPSTLQLLRAFGADLAQGYGIAPPMPASELGAWLHERPRAAGALADTTMSVFA